MNKKIFALLLSLTIIEVASTSVIEAVYDGACCPVNNNRCCLGRPYGYPRWKRCITNCCRWFRPKRICCPRYRCCPIQKCCPTFEPLCQAYSCAEQVCQGGYSEPVNGYVSTNGQCSTGYTNNGSHAQAEYTTGE